jgi:hypothetical protein
MYHPSKRENNASNWGMIIGSLVEVTGFVSYAHMWSYNEEERNRAVSSPYGLGVVMLLRGARDMDYEDDEERGIGLFPQIIKTELREVSSVIEAYSNKNTLESPDEPHVCGIAIDKDYNTNQFIGIRITNANSIKTKYIIDRYE